MTVQLVRAHRLYAGVPHAYASVAEPGALVFTAGACPLDENEMVVGAGGVRRQAQQVMANLTEALAAAGAALTDVLKTTVYVAWVTAVTCSPPGTSSALCSESMTRRARCSGFPPRYRDQLVEVEAVALIGGPGSER
jgi:enamine deaminase RidA (YjgF/YER057c/UK114 family)